MPFLQNASSCCMEVRLAVFDSVLDSFPSETWKHCRPFMHVLFSACGSLLLVRRESALERDSGSRSWMRADCSGQFSSKCAVCVTVCWWIQAVASTRVVRSYDDQLRSFCGGRRREMLKRGEDRRKRISGLGLQHLRVRLEQFCSCCIILISLSRGPFLNGGGSKWEMHDRYSLSVSLPLITRTAAWWQSIGLSLTIIQAVTHQSSLCTVCARGVRERRRRRRGGSGG